MGAAYPLAARLASPLARIQVRLLSLCHTRSPAARTSPRTAERRHRRRKKGANEKPRAPSPGLRIFRVDRSQYLATRGLPPNLKLRPPLNTLLRSRMSKLTKVIGANGVKPILLVPKS